MTAKKKSNIKQVGKTVEETLKQVKSLADIYKSKKEAARLRSKKSYTLRELPVKYRKTLAGFLHEIENNYEKVDQLKRPGEMWAASVYGNYTKQLFTNTDQLAGYLLKYRDLLKEGSGKDRIGVIEGLQFVKFGKAGQSEIKTYKAFKKQREEKVAKRVGREKRAITAASKKVTGKKVEGQPKKISKTEKMVGLLEALLEENKRLQRELNKLKKKPSKKTTPKKSAVKSSAKKSTPKKGIGTHAKNKTKPVNKSKAKATPKKSAGRVVSPSSNRKQSVRKDGNANKRKGISSKSAKVSSSSRPKQSAKKKPPAKKRKS